MNQLQEQLQDFPLVTERELMRLEQIVAEDTYSRRHIREVVREDIEKSGEAINEGLQRGADAVKEYLDGSYYDSKEARLNQIRHIDTMEIALEVLISILAPSSQMPGQIRIQRIIGDLHGWLGYEDTFDSAKTGSELVAVMEKSELYTMHAAGYEGEAYMSVVPQITLDDSTLEFIARTRYMNPMLCQPRRWKNNTGGGYLTICESALLGKAHHNSPQALDVLNILQSIPWELDPDVMNEEEKPTKVLETDEQKASFELMKTISRKVYDEIDTYPFWFQWRYDFRGRAYSSGYYINLQASEYKKASLNFKRKQKVTQ